MVHRGSVKGLTKVHFGQAHSWIRQGRRRPGRPVSVWVVDDGNGSGAVVAETMDVGDACRSGRILLLLLPPMAGEEDAATTS
jgi:hypothetical protein